MTRHPYGLAPRPLSAASISLFLMANLTSSMSTCARAPRIAVVGGGVAACSFVRHAARLLKTTSPRGGAMASTLLPDLHVFEMGRGVGGRAATRRSRELKELSISHGAPFFTARCPEVVELCQDLVRSGHVTPWQGAVLRVGGGGLEAAGEDAQELFTGVGGMNNLCEGLVKACEMDVHLHPSTMIKRFEAVPVPSAGVDEGSTAPPAPGAGHLWRLYDKQGEALGDFDWLVVTGSGVAHPRWSNVFGGAPPLTEAVPGLSAVGNPGAARELQGALERMAGIGALPVTAIMARFGPSTPAATALAGLPFTVLELEARDGSFGSGGDGSGMRSEMLRTIVLSKDAAGGVGVVIHSTSQYAAKILHVHGATSTAARLAGAQSSKSAEGDIANEMCREFARILVQGGWEEAAAAFEGAALRNGDSAPAPSEQWGPHLHRWGNAFPDGDLLPEASSMLSDAKVLFCGDYIDYAVDFPSPKNPAQQGGSVESALYSGIAAAKSLLECLRLRDASDGDAGDKPVDPAASL